MYVLKINYGGVVVEGALIVGLGFEFAFVKDDGREGGSIWWWWCVVGFAMLSCAWREGLKRSIKVLRVGVGVPPHWLIVRSING